MSGRGVGLANATNSNTDTTARVHTTARVCINLYNSLADPTLVKRNPADYKAIKEEIALGISRPFAPLGMSYAEQRGLAPIFTNTGVINGGKQDDLMRWYIRYYDCRSKEERVAHCATSCVVKGQAYYPSELYFAGMVISEAEADPMNGDTALTLMIGGKITVKNGRFPIQTGDTIMWYFEEEADAKMFDDEGMRKRRSTSSTIDYTETPSAMQQRIRDFTYAERAASRKTAFVKPYIVGVDRRGATYADASRIVGTACSNAGGYERVDIKLSRMSH